MNLKIRHLLSALLGLMALISLGFIIWESLDLTVASHKANWLVQANRLSDLVIKANSIQARERGLTNIMISRPESVTSEMRARMYDLRAAGDAPYRQALPVARKIIGQDTSHPLNESLQNLAERRAALDSARALIYRILDNEDIPMARELWIDTMNDFIASLAQLRRTALAPVDELGRAYHDNLLTKEIVFTVSEYAGRERAIIGAAIAEGRPLSAEEVRRLISNRITVDNKLDQLVLEIEETDREPLLKEAIGRFNEEFLGRYQQLREAVYTASEQHAPYPVDASTWFAEATRGIDSVLAVSTAIGRQTAQSTSKVQQEKTRESVILISLISVILAAMVFTVVLVRRRILKPLSVLAKASEQIAEGDLHQPVAVSGNDEFSVLARSFEHMRRSLLSDITQRERAEAALQESEARSRAIVNEAADGIITIDETGVIQIFSPAAEHIFGYSADEVIGQNVNLLIPMPERHQHNGYLRRYREMGEDHFIGAGPRELLAQHRDGSTFPIELAINEMHLGEQRCFYVGILRDITERKQAEDTLRASEERFALVASGTQDGIWDWDLSSGQIYFSPRWKTMLDYDQAEIEDNFMALQALIHPDDLGTALDSWMACMEGKTDAFSIEYRLRNKQGDYRWIQCRGLAQLDDQGNPVRMAGSHSDITRRRQAYTDLQQMAADLEAKAEALERSNQELDQFAYIASHDLKAPLRAIANLSQWIEEDLEEVMTDDTCKQMTLLRSRVLRMENLINGILQYSRVGRIDMDVEDVNVRQLLLEILDGLAPPPGFRIDIATDMPTLQMARVPLFQVFSNLLSNAIKYHDQPESAQVSVSVKLINDEAYEFSVADNGPGIDPAYHDKVFQIFQTLNARDKVESTGVGLTIVKKILDQLGGEIDLDSTEGEGAIFRFTLPVTSNEDRVANDAYEVHHVGGVAG